MLIFDILKHGSSTLNFNSSDNIAWIIKCDISKSKLALSTCNGVYFSSTALIVFTLYEIKQVKIFFRTPGTVGSGQFKTLYDFIMLLKPICNSG